ncbi:MAG: hypothetical protein ABIG60_03055 [Patescibacteria group bacterium]
MMEKEVKIGNCTICGKKGVQVIEVNPYSRACKGDCYGYILSIQRGYVPEEIPPRSLLATAA